MRNFFKNVLTKINKLSRPQTDRSDGLDRKLPKGKQSPPDTPSGQPRPEKEGRAHRRRPPRKKKRRPREAATRPAAADADWRPSQFKVPPAEGKTRFHDFDLPDPLLHAIADLGFEYCTPIQAEILPAALSGKDASGRAQTGTGKTAAFLITVITRMLQNPISGKRPPGTPRILVVAPTRELVLQISEEARDFSKYCDLNIVSVFGGMDYEKQKKQLSGVPVDIIVATPGRLLDFQRRRDLSLGKVEVLILDEGDRMLDMGFIPDVRKIIYATPPKDKRQTLLFSATLTEEITRLASQWTRNPVTIEIEPEQVAVDTVDQVVYLVTRSEKFALLYNVIDRKNLERVLVFCNRRDEVRRLAEMLTRFGINCAELSGDVHQKQRIRRLDEFKAGKIRALVATDVAGRGIHIEGMDHVINFTLPRDAEDYVHRIGRTGRAGAAGTSISFADEEDSFYIPAIEEFMDRKLPCIEPDPEWLIMPKAVHPRKKSRSASERNPAPRRRGGGPSKSGPGRRRGPRRPGNPSRNRNAAP